MYGYRVQDAHDPLIEDADAMMEATEYAISGGWIVDYLPIRKLYLADR